MCVRRSLHSDPTQFELRTLLVHSTKGPLPIVFTKKACGLSPAPAPRLELLTAMLAGQYTQVSVGPHRPCQHKLNKLYINIYRTLC